MVAQNRGTKGTIKCPVSLDNVISGVRFPPSEIDAHGEKPHFADSGNRSFASCEERHPVRLPLKNADAGAILPSIAG